jgi:hypothetical protein
VDATVERSRPPVKRIEATWPPTMPRATAAAARIPNTLPREALLQAKVEHIIGEAGEDGIGWNALCRKLLFSRTAIAQVVADLRKAGLVKAEKVKTAKRPRLTLRWIQEKQQ